MSMFTIRNIPKDLHRRWKSIAANSDISMMDLVLQALEVYIGVLEKKIAEERPAKGYSSEDLI